MDVDEQIYMKIAPFVKLIIKEPDEVFQPTTHSFAELIHSEIVEIQCSKIKRVSWHHLTILCIIGIFARKKLITFFTQYCVKPIS